MSFRAARNNYLFILSNLVLKDFKVRYRNMSLGVFWSLVNPLFMMIVLTFVFTKIFASNDIPHYGVFVLCGLVPLSFFQIGWASGTTSVLENGGLVKRVRFPREIIPIASVCSNCLHFGIQLCLLVVFVLAAGYGMNRYWLWLPFIFGLEVIFVCGLAMISSALDVYYRDLRYVVESANLVMFWLVPVIYSFAIIPQQYRLVYQYNPISAVVLACRDVFLDGKAPATSLLVKLFAVSFFMLGVGLLVFGKMKRRFADYV
jgi:ABC-type polysaccharide/polyol phosphate export permease